MRVVHRHHVLVTQARGRNTLLLEPPNGLPVVLQLARQHLQRDDAVQRGLVGTVYNPHPTVAELLQDLVWTYRGDIHAGLSGWSVIAISLTFDCRCFIPLSSGLCRGQVAGGEEVRC